MNYKKINKETVLNHLQRHIDCDGITILHSAKSIATGLKTSVYQARKFLKQLESEGFIKYTSRILCSPEYESGICYCDNHLPEWGYEPTQKLRGYGLSVNQ